MLVYREAKFPKVNFAIDGGILSGPPSIVIDLSGEEEKVIRGKLRYKKGKKDAEGRI
ncbi:MAG: hypothetical protein MUP55_03530 [Candidatus Aenigmarchaeota archaeon]|nr:hypothetical protein [Candidatus Aenigmarchaeota archaeon]